MKKSFNLTFVMILALAITLVVTGCSSGPKLGPPNEIQQLLNALPAVNIAGKSLKFKFGGKTWISKVNGKGFLAGTLTLEDTADGFTLTLEQTHIYSTEQKPGIGGDVGWIKTPGPNIVLEYKKGPPESLSVK